MTIGAVEKVRKSEDGKLEVKVKNKYTGEEIATIPADSTESLPLVISGFPSDFKTNWSPIVPAFLGIHHLEFAGAWGVAEYLISSEK